MGQICSDTKRVHDIIEGQMRDQTRLLQEEGQGLADSTSGTADRNWVKERTSEIGGGVRSAAHSDERPRSPCLDVSSIPLTILVYESGGVRKSKLVLRVGVLE